MSVCGWFAEVCVGGPFPVWADPGHRGTKDPFSWNLLWQAVHWLHHRLSVSLGVYPINPICCRSFLRISLPIGNRSQSKLGGHLEDTWRTPAETIKRWDLPIPMWSMCHSMDMSLPFVHHDESLREKEGCFMWHVRHCKTWLAWAEMTRGESGPCYVSWTKLLCRYYILRYAMRCLEKTWSGASSLGEIASLRHLDSIRWGVWPKADEQPNLDTDFDTQFFATLQYHSGCSSCWFAMKKAGRTRLGSIVARSICVSMWDELHNTCNWMSHGSNITQQCATAWSGLTCCESSLSGQVLGVEVRKQKEFLHGDAFQRPVAACISSSISSSASSTSFANKHPFSPFQFGLSMSKYARKGLAWGNNSAELPHSNVKILQPHSG